MKTPLAEFDGGRKSVGRADLVEKLKWRAHMHIKWKHTQIFSTFPLLYSNIYIYIYVCVYLQYECVSICIIGVSV